MLIMKNMLMSLCKCICFIKEDMWYFFVIVLLNNFNGLLEMCIYVLYYYVSKLKK